jgi:RNA polymerase sigma factor (sigma-70 family)
VQPGSAVTGTFADFPIAVRTVPRMPDLCPPGAGVSDACLVTAAQRGDARAADALLRRYDRVLLATVHALRLPKGVDAHDVLQAARLGLADAIAAWRPGGAPFRVFARTCARRDAITAIDKARAAQRRVLADAASLEDLALAGREPTSDEYAPALGCDPLRIVLAREQLETAIAVLPTLGRCEAACLTGWLNGCTYTELARSLGGTRKTVECSIRRARRKITTALERT